MSALLQRRGGRIAAWGAAALVLACSVAAGWITRQSAHELLTNPEHSRPKPGRTPADEGLSYQSVYVIAEDGVKTVGWYLPGEPGPLVMVLHGYKEHRGQVLDVATVLGRHRYGVLVTSTRGHDMSDGNQITFGTHEMKDVAAWHAFARTLAGVDAARIGMYGSSMGGSLAIQYAADHADIRAVVADCAFSSLDDTVAVSVPHRTGLPAFPFAPMIVFWAEREADFDTASIDAKKWIGRLSPRPVLLLQGGRDEFIDPASGQRLYDAAGEPKELWFDPDVGHTTFARDRPEEFERRITDFFERSLPGPTGPNSPTGREVQGGN